MPGAQPAHDLLTVRTEAGVIGLHFRWCRLQLRAGWRIPGFLLGGSEQRRLAQESAHAVEPDLGGGMQPAKSAHAGEVAWQGVLEEAA